VVVEGGGGEYCITKHPFQRATHYFQLEYQRALQPVQRLLQAWRGGTKGSLCRECWRSRLQGWVQRRLEGLVLPCHRHVVPRVPLQGCEEICQKKGC
jgi:hypothetical protein